MPAPAFPAHHHMSGNSDPDRGCPFPFPPQAPQSEIRQVHRIRQARRRVTLHRRGQARCPLPRRLRIPHPHHRRRGSLIPVRPASGRRRTRTSLSRPDSRMYRGSPGPCTARQSCQALSPVRAPVLSALRTLRHRRILPQAHRGTRTRRFPCMPRTLPLHPRR